MGPTKSLTFSRGPKGCHVYIYISYISSKDGYVYYIYLVMPCLQYMPKYLGFPKVKVEIQVGEVASYIRKATLDLVFYISHHKCRYACTSYCLANRIMNRYSAFQDCQFLLVAPELTTIRYTKIQKGF